MPKTDNQTGYPSDSQSRTGGGLFPLKKEEYALDGLPEHIRAWFANLQKFDILFCIFRKKNVVYQFVKHTACSQCNTKIACFMRNRRDLTQRRQIRDAFMSDLFGISKNLVCLTQEHGKDAYSCIQFRLNDLDTVIGCERGPGGDREVLLDAQSTKNRLTTVMYSITSQLNDLPQEES